MMAETLVGVSPTEPQQLQDPHEPDVAVAAGGVAPPPPDASAPAEAPTRPAAGRAPPKQDLAALQRLVRQAQEDGVGPDRPGRAAEDADQDRDRGRPG